MWVATVSNINFPSRQGLSAAEGQAELVGILDLMVSLNLNAIVFQVRPEGDALYDSDIEPWSRYLTEWTPEGVDWYLQPWFRGHRDQSWALEPGDLHVDPLDAEVGEPPGELTVGGDAPVGKLLQVPEPDAETIRRCLDVAVGFGLYVEVGVRVVVGVPVSVRVSVRVGVRVGVPVGVEVRVEVRVRVGVRVDGAASSAACERPEGEGHAENASCSPSSHEHLLDCHRAR